MYLRNLTLLLFLFTVFLIGCNDNDDSLIPPDKEEEKKEEEGKDKEEDKNKEEEEEEEEEGLVEEAWFLKKTNGETEKFFPIGAWRIPGYEANDPNAVSVYNRQSRNINISFHYIGQQRKDIIYMSIRPSYILMDFLSRQPDIKNKGNEKGYYESQYLKNIESDNILKNKLSNELANHMYNEYPNVERAYLPIDEVSMGLASNYWYTPPVVGDWIYKKIIELEKQKDPNANPIVFADLAGHGKGSTYFFEKRYLKDHSSMPDSPPYEMINESAQEYANHALNNNGLPLLGFLEGFNGVPAYKFSPTSYSYTSYSLEQLKSYHYENIKAYAEAYKGNGNAFGINAFRDFAANPILAGLTVDAIRAGLGDPEVPIWLFFDGNGYARGNVPVDNYIKQIKCQMYTSITHGATGVFFWNNPSGQEVWDALQPTLEEMKGNLDIIRLKTLEKRDDNDMHLMIKKDNKGQKYIIATNTSKTSTVPLKVDNLEKNSLAPLEVYIAPF
ncbi:MAG: hypothetical protein PHN55_00590 [Dysgonamonadaceae bacterium]|nr:hypothetical protein [Dysgonamonadaceae bacterium]